jgi:sporulation protein YlmC with PRC-barrel domain
MMNVLDLMDREVIGLNGWLIGTVKNVIFDENSWQIRSLDVQLDGEVAKEFEMKKVFRSTHIPLDVSHVQGIGDKVSLKTSKEDLMALVGTLEAPSDAPTSQ